MNGTRTAADQLVAEYLNRLREVTRDLEPALRADILLDVEQHIRDARGAAAADDLDAVREILAGLGPADQIARATGSPSTARSQRSPSERAYDRITVGLLAVGLVTLPALGWVVGVVLLWRGPRWTLRDRLLGTLVTLGPSAFLAVNTVLLFAMTKTMCIEPVDGPMVCDGPPGPPAWLVLVLYAISVVIGVLTCGHLAARAGRADRAARTGRSPSVAVAE
jgi:HAAS